MDLKDIQNEAEHYYESNEKRFEKLRAALAVVLEEVAFDAGVKVHHVSARKKTRASYIEKFERKRALQKPTDVQDLVGGRIVTLFRSDLKRLEDKLPNVFILVSEENKIQNADDDQFGYMSVHYICRLHDRLSGPHYDGLHELEFEIQLRTILMDAWANVSHHIDYKGNSSIPDGLKRDFNALSALFYVADSSFEQFYDESRRSKETAIASLQNPEGQSVPLNADTLRAALRKWFPDRDHVDDSEVSVSTEEILALTSIATIEDLGEIVDKWLPAALRYESDKPPSAGDGEPDDGRFFDAGLLRVILGISDPEFARGRSVLTDGYGPYRDSPHSEPN